MKRKLNRVNDAREVLVEKVMAINR